MSVGVFGAPIDIRDVEVNKLLFNEIRSSQSNGLHIPVPIPNIETTTSTMVATR